MWLALSSRLRDGEALYSNEQFRVAMLEIYEQITGQTAADSVATELTKMIESVNRDHPETNLAQAVENGVAKAFEEGVRRHNWDLAKIQEKGASALKRFSQLDVVRDVFEDAKLHPTQLSIANCMQKVIDQVATKQDATPSAVSKRAPAFRPDLAPAESTVIAAPPAAEKPMDEAAEAAVADVDVEVARRRAQEGESNSSNVPIR